MLSLERDGSLRKMEVKGELRLTIVDPEAAFLALTCVLDEACEQWLKGKAVTQFRVCYARGNMLLCS